MLQTKNISGKVKEMKVHDYNFYNSELMKMCLWRNFKRKVLYVF